MIKFLPAALKPLLGTFRRLPGVSQRALLGSVFFGLAAGGSSTGLLMLINDTLAREQRAGTASLAAFLGLCFLMLVAGVVSEVLILRLTQNNLFDLRLWISRRILSAPLSQLQTCGAPRLMAALTDDISSVAHAHQALPVLFIEGSIALGGLIYVGYLSPTLLVILLLLLTIGLSIFFVTQRWSLHWVRLARDADDALFGHFRALTEGCKELKMNARRRGAFLDEELSVTASIIRTRFNRGLTIFIVGAHASKLLFFIAIGFALFVPSLFRNSPADTVTGWTLSILFIMGPISTIVNTIPALGQGLVALRKLEALGFSMSEEPLVGMEDKPLGAPVEPGVLELSGLRYSYRSETERSEFTLGPLDLRIDPGELIFMTGGNGSGKTTFAYLLLGLFVADKGEIRLNGKPIAGNQWDAFRQNFAVVFADAFNFDSLLGYHDANSLARAGNFLKEFQLDHKITIQNGRFSTVELSRGQRKRLALLTAFIEDRPFYLFDEWAAEQDPIFREIFYTKILSQLKARGKTVIVITHDERYYPVADRLLRLDSGKIEETPVHGPIPSSGSMRRVSCS